MLPYRAEARQETLRAFGIAKAAHATLAFPRGLMSVFDAIVYSSTGFDEDVLKICQFSNRSFRGRGAALLVGHDLARHVMTRGQHPLEKPLGCSRVATLLQQDIEFRAMLIDCSP